jgi:hypothetical protein
MSTSADVISDLASAFEGLAGTRTRMASDYRADLQAIASGQTLYQIRLVPAGQSHANSNVSRVLAGIELAVAHRLSSPTAESTYTAGTMQTDLTTLTAASWWRALAAVYDVESLEASVERIGHTIIYTVTATVVVQN